MEMCLTCGREKSRRYRELTSVESTKGTLTAMQTVLVGRAHTSPAPLFLLLDTTHFKPHSPRPKGHKISTDVKKSVPPVPGTAVAGAEQDPMFAGWLVCPAQHPGHPSALPQPSAVTPLLHLGLPESWLEQWSSVLYNSPSFLLSCEKPEDFQPSSSLPPSGKWNFSCHDERRAELDLCCDPEQALCP